MKFNNVCIFGGAGFVGSQIVELLSGSGIAVRVPTRRRDNAKHLLVFPTAEIVELDIHDDAQLAAALSGCDAVINLVGILHDKPGTPYGAAFSQVHVELPKRIAVQCVKLGIRRVVHMSALGVASDAPSRYMRSKADGDKALLALQSQLDVTVFRPSIIFGEKDNFFNLFATLQRYLPVMMLGCPDAKFQPVWLNDVARAFVEALGDIETFGQTYELVGPKVYTLREMVRYAGEASGHPRPIIGLGKALSFLQAAALELLPMSLMSRDNYYSMQRDNVSAEGFPARFGRPTPLEAASAYLTGKFPRSRYQQYRARKSGESTS